MTQRNVNPHLQVMRTTRKSTISVFAMTVIVAVVAGPVALLLFAAWLALWVVLGDRAGP